MNSLIAVLTIVAGALVIFHHLLYPILMKTHARTEQPQGNEVAPKNWPSIAIVVPAYNEERWIADKLRNLASLDYPQERLTVYIGFDGCNDDSYAIAKATLDEPVCEQLNCRLYNFCENRGKVAVLNELIANTQAELVALSDVSALLSIDALQLAAMHFTNPKVGVVNSHYLLMTSEDAGEQAYWRYQNRVKVVEASLATPMGTHGALYLFRRQLFSPLAPDTINDDFILPMSIAAKGYLGVQENRIHAVEMEPSGAEQNFARRIRIGAGNLQQVLRLKHLLNPSRGKLSLLFWAGKTLRVACGYLMLIALAGSIYLAPGSILFSVLALAQLLGWTLGLAGIAIPTCRRIKLLRTLGYLITGHMAILIGSSRYLLGLERGQWTKVTDKFMGGKSL